MALGTAFIRSNLAELEVAKEAATVIANDIRSEFLNMLNEAQWLDNRTKSVAIEKAKKITFFIGYTNLSQYESEMNEYYSGLLLRSENYFQNVMSLQKFELSKHYRKLRQQIPEDPIKIRLTDFATSINAIYNYDDNNICKWI